eukprot:4293950-Amphidinium_carterae.1
MGAEDRVGQRQEAARGVTEEVEQHACGRAASQQRQRERNVQGRWQAKHGCVRWMACVLQAHSGRKDGVAPACQNVGQRSQPRKRARSYSQPETVGREAWLGPSPRGGWTCNGQWFSWDEATLRAKWDSAEVLCAEVARTRKAFEGLAAGLSTSAYRQLKLDGQISQSDRRRTGKALNAALGG